MPAASIAPSVAPSARSGCSVLPGCLAGLGAWDVGGIARLAELRDRVDITSEELAQLKGEVIGREVARG